MNIAAVAAHPDDVEISCGGTLAKYRRLGHETFIILMTSGNMGSNKYTREELGKIRQYEGTEAARVLGAKIMLLGFDDSELVDSPQVRRKVVDALRWANPDVILTHYPFDNSADHACTSRIVGASLLSLRWKNVPDTVYQYTTKNPSVFYWDTNGGVSFNPEAYVDITDDMEIKAEAFKQHKSQIEFEWLRTLEIVSAYRGLQSGCKYAEGFIGHKILEYMPDYKLLP